MPASPLAPAAGGRGARSGASTQTPEPAGLPMTQASLTAQFERGLDALLDALLDGIASRIKAGSFTA